MIDFRWVAFIALWTLLSGPIFSQPGSSGTAPQEQTVSASQPKPK
jgi:hypothetical protein